MARLREYSTAHGSESNQTGKTSAGSSRRVTSGSSNHPSPAPSFSSDKENNHGSRAPSRGSKGKTSSGRMSTTGHSERRSSVGPSQKRKANDSLHNPSQSRHQRELDQRVDKTFYDPDQDDSERRAIRKGMRALNKEVNDTRPDLLKAESHGIVTIIEKSNKLFESVKQTPDAVIDSRTLVQTADIALRKTTEITLGDASMGVDVDAFVAKCITSMRRGGQETGGTQSQRRSRDEDEDEEDSGDHHNWAYLGRRACFPNNSRPCVPSFLLGPLSIQKKARQQTQRKAREVRANAADATRPQALGKDDLDKQETTNLTQICGEIARHLDRIRSDAMIAAPEACERAQEERDLTDEERMDLALSYGISDDGCVPLLNFCINPRSFGQTVENLFYISFLIKEGAVGLNFDGRGLPTLACAGKGEGGQAKGSSKNQAVFALDFETWEALIESLGIKESLIPHRQEEVYEDGVLDGSGWYG